MTLFVIFVTFCLHFQRTAKPIFKIPHQTLKSDIFFLFLSAVALQQVRHTSYLVWKHRDGICRREQAVVTPCMKKKFLFCQHTRAAVVCWVWGQALKYIWVLVFFDFFWWCSHICTEPGPQEFVCVWDKLALPSLCRAQCRLKGRSLFRVLQNCLHCAWVQMEPYRAEDLVECCPHP